MLQINEGLQTPMRLIRSFLLVGIVCIIAAVVFLLNLPVVGGEPGLKKDAQIGWIKTMKMRAAYIGAFEVPVNVVAKIKRAGMNSLLVKFGGVNVPLSPLEIKTLKAWGDAARAAEMNYFVVFDYRNGNEMIKGARHEVDEYGQRWERTPCPLDSRYRQRWVTDRAEALAQVSKEFFIDGILIDVEMYGADPDHRSYRRNCYCDDCIREFIASRGEPLPDHLPKLVDREKWLRRRWLSSEYDKWFAARLEDLAAKIEAAVHKVNPDLMLGGMGLDSPKPFELSFVKGLGTADRPMLYFSELSYDTGYNSKVAALQRGLENDGYKFLFIAGFNIASIPSENLAEQGYVAASEADGYWIWSFAHLLRDMPAYAGYQLRDPKPLYWEALQKANQELDRTVISSGASVSQLRARPFKPVLPFLRLKRLNEERMDSCACANAASHEAVSVQWLVGNCPVYLIAKKGEEVRARLDTIDLLLMRFTGTVHYAVFGADGSMPAEGVMPIGEQRIISWLPKTDGVYAIVVEAKQSAYQIEVISGQPFGVKASKEQVLTVNRDFGQQFFSVPGGSRGFSVFAKVKKPKLFSRAKIQVFSPDGKVAKSFEGDFTQWTEVQINYPDSAAPGLWSIKATGISDELSLYLSGDVSAVLSPRADRAVRSGR